MERTGSKRTLLLSHLLPGNHNWLEGSYLASLDLQYSFKWVSTRKKNALGFGSSYIVSSPSKKTILSRYNPWSKIWKDSTYLQSCDVFGTSILLLNDLHRFKNLVTLHPHSHKFLPSHHRRSGILLKIPPLSGCNTGIRKNLRLT